MGIECLRLYLLSLGVRVVSATGCFHQTGGFLPGKMKEADLRKEIFRLGHRLGFGAWLQMVTRADLWFGGIDGWLVQEV